MERLTLEELESVMDDPKTSREDLITAAQLSRWGAGRKACRGAYRVSIAAASADDELRQVRNYHRPHDAAVAGSPKGAVTEDRCALCSQV